MWRFPACVGTMALALLTAGSGIAYAAHETWLPESEDARGFATSAGGWGSGVSYSGLGCGLLVACPSASGVYEAGGYLRSRLSTGIGLLSSATVTWTSPAFTAPAEIAGRRWVPRCGPTSTRG
jgi:hypothetical protein